MLLILQAGDSSQMLVVCISMIVSMVALCTINRKLLPFQHDCNQGNYSKQPINFVFAAI